MSNAKDLLPACAKGESRPLEELRRPLERVSEFAPISEVLRELRRCRQHLAPVADEHGTTVGLVTLGDMPEELVGDGRRPRRAGLAAAAGPGARVR
jgi:CBS domain containing-hemolysin-like protein